MKAYPIRTNGEIYEPELTEERMASMGNNHRKEKERECKCSRPYEIELTNFENITKSEEKLASWLDEHAEFCQEISCNECYVNKECGHQGCDVDFSSNAKRWLLWLKQPHTPKE